MKVLVIHNLHRKGSASGDDQVFRDETALLEEGGIEVIRYTAGNDEFDNVGILGKVLTTFGMLWSFKHYRAVRRIIRKNNPDLVHIHTFFPLLSPSILYAAKREGKKVVATLHDTRFICPCSTSLRGDKICNRCGDGRYFRMVKYGCFKGSRLQSFIVAFIFKVHRKLGSFYKQIDRYIVLNNNQIRLLKKIGFDESKIVKKYNFVPDQKVSSAGSAELGLPDRYVVFYGRIGEEKGVRVLMKIWEGLDLIPLVIMGGGPLEDELKSWASGRDNVRYLGYTQHDRCLEIVKGGEFVMFPSIWYEGCSMVEIETESLGKALVATDLGFSHEAIKDGSNGFKVKLGDVAGFRERVLQLWNDPELCRRMGENARADYEKKYRPGDNLRQLKAIYEGLLGQKKGVVLNDDVRQNKELVSVIIPTHNRADMITASINSILDQDYTNLEVIVVDDGSTDNTDEVVARIKDARLRYFKYPESRGANYARNYGIKEAKGEYIAFNDSDDTWHKNKLSVQLSAMKEAGVLFSFCKKRTLVNGIWEALPNDLSYDGIIAKEDLFISSKVGTQCIVAKRECFDHEMFDEELPRSQDFELTIRMARRYDILFVDEELVDCFYSAKSITSNTAAGIKSYEMIINKHRDIYDKYPEVKRSWLMLLADQKYLAGLDYKKEYKEALKIRFSVRDYVKYLANVFGIMVPVRRLYRILSPRYKIQK